MKLRIAVGISLIVVACGGLALAYEIYRAVDEMGRWEVGMATIELPSGSKVYLRRQAIYPGAAELYLSESDDYCAPYDRRHDYKLSSPVQGGTDTPLLVSLVGSTIVVHAPEPPATPWFTKAATFSVRFEKISEENYSAYAVAKAAGPRLPGGWQRIEVPFGHNTCAL
jgi:hypothetical protein